MLAENRCPAVCCVRVNPRDLGKGATRGAYGIGKKWRRPGRCEPPGTAPRRGRGTGPVYGKVRLQPLM
ncbi:hypothetical protein GCM10018771_57190 [Streptomyces cellulosae]|nr:hypothetical protein GCM10018771_57190 [Streptomyces cellulosae]